MRRVWLQITAGIILTIAWSQAAWCSKAPSEYDQAIKRVRLLSNLPNVRLLQFGRSPEGRSIPALVISDFSVASADKARILVCSGQHGDEPNPVRSVLSLCGKLASGSDPDLLARSVIVVVPMANPDGLAHSTRANSLGTDINRDWSTQRSPEAQFVNRIIKAWRPHILIDAHEWLSSPAGIPGNEIEVPPCVMDSQAAAMRGIGEAVESRTSLAMIKCNPNSHTGLFHRHYASIGYAAFLLETDAGVGYESKDRAYQAAIIRAARLVTENADSRLTLSPASKGFGISAVAAYLEPLPEDAPDASSPVMAACALAAVYCLLLVAMKPFTRSQEPAWSHRFRKCEMEAGIDADSLRLKRSLAPLTSRSWVKRHTRKRYSTAAREETRREPPTIDAPSLSFDLPTPVAQRRG